MKYNFLTKLNTQTEKKLIKKKFTFFRNSLTILSVSPCWQAYIKLLQPRDKRLSPAVSHSVESGFNFRWFTFWHSIELLIKNFSSFCRILLHIISEHGLITLILKLYSEKCLCVYQNCRGCFNFSFSRVRNNKIFHPFLTNNQKINRFRETTNYKTFLYYIQHFIQK